MLYCKKTQLFTRIIYPSLRSNTNMTTLATLCIMVKLDWLKIAPLCYCAVMYIFCLGAVHTQQILEVIIVFHLQKTTANLKKFSISYTFCKLLLDTCPFVTSPLGFKAKPEWAALFTLGRGICDINSLRFSSGVTPLLMYNSSIAASRLPHMCVLAEVGCWDLNPDLLLSSLLH